MPSVISKAFHGVNGAVFLVLKSHGAIRCSFILLGMVWCSVVRFSHFESNTVRCSAVFLLNGAVRYGLHFSRTARCGAVRCGYGSV